MIARPDAPQRLPPLASLPQALACIEALARPVAPRAVDLTAAIGRVLATDVAVASLVPAVATALRDGWAIRADLLSDAGPYAPQPLVPRPAFIEIGAPLPPGADAVLAFDAVVVRDGAAEALASAVPGEGVLAAGADAVPQTPLRRAGEPLRAIDLAVLRAAGVPRVAVREPKLRLVTANWTIDAVDDTVAPFMARAIGQWGGVAEIVRLAPDGEQSLDRTLAAGDVDAVVVIGGTGSGRHDASVRTLARLGRVDIHGIGLVPGETSALGAIDARPVLVVPGRLDAAVAVWLVLGRYLLARLTARSAEDPVTPLRLVRKIVSTVGLAEVVLVRRCDGGVEPVASGVFPLQALARADGFVLVAPQSEGHPPGAVVDMQALP